ncbi:MAG: DUF808 family protein, partial [Pseudomonadota bacterium]
LYLSKNGVTAFGRKMGALIVRGMPGFMTVLTVVGTAAMLWVGGNIVVHALHEMGLHLPYDTIKTAASLVGDAGFGNWFVTALLDGILGIAMGFVVMKLVAPVLGLLNEQSAKGH